MPVFMASTAGGMEIEEVAKEHPEAILRETIHPATGLQAYQARKLAFGLGLAPEHRECRRAIFSIALSRVSSRRTLRFWKSIHAW